MPIAAHHSGRNSAPFAGISITALGVGYVCGHYDLSCLSESPGEAFEIDPLNAGAFFQRAMSSQGGAFAKNHKRRFHANGGKAYVTRGNTERYQEILTLFSTRREGFIANGKCSRDAVIKFSFPHHLPTVDEAPASMVPRPTESGSLAGGFS